MDDIDLHTGNEQKAQADLSGDEQLFCYPQYPPVERSANPDLDRHPIFIVGILPRSGTNFLYHLLSLHPNCRVGGVIWEDFLLAHADLIVRYAQTVRKHWDRTWELPSRIDPPEAALCRSLGEGLISFLHSQVCDSPLQPQAQTVSGGEIGPRSKRLITKTPSVRNLQHFSKLFPDAHLIIVVRDGRALVESGVRSFNWGYEQATRAWAKAARTVIQFDRDHAKSDCKYLITKYEDLVLDTASELRRIFSFLALDPDRYDFQAASSSPVIGSCELRRHEEKDIHWDPRERTQAFNPVDRASKWGRQKHERFNWIAGDYLVQLGYLKRTAPHNRVLWKLWNIALDAKSTFIKAESGTYAPF